MSPGTICGVSGDFARVEKSGAWLTEDCRKERLESAFRGGEPLKCPAPVVASMVSPCPFGHGFIVNTFGFKPDNEGGCVFHGLMSIQLSQLCAGGRYIDCWDQNECCRNAYSNIDEDRRSGGGKVRFFNRLNTVSYLHSFFKTKLF